MGNEYEDRIEQIVMEFCDNTVNGMANAVFTDTASPQKLLARLIELARWVQTYDGYE